MSKTVGYCLLAVAAALATALSICAPWVLSDQNAFLRSFVNQELLSFLAVVVTVTLASAANLHLSLNRLEEGSTAERPFERTRRSVRSSVTALLWLIPLAVLVVVIKPLVIAKGPKPIAESFCNGFALLLVLTSALLLIDITQAVFMIPPKPTKR